MSQHMEMPWKLFSNVLELRTEFSLNTIILEGLKWSFRKSLNYSTIPPTVNKNVPIVPWYYVLPL